MNLDRTYMTTKELAKFLGKAETTIRKMRLRGDGPKGVRIGRDVMKQRQGAEHND